VPFFQVKPSDIALLAEKAKEGQPDIGFFSRTLFQEQCQDGTDGGKNCRILLKPM
jgi:hypothetical protein